MEKDGFVEVQKHVKKVMKIAAYAKNARFYTKNAQKYQMISWKSVLQ